MSRTWVRNAEHVASLAKTNVGEPITSLAPEKLAEVCTAAQPRHGLLLLVSGELR
jgi:mRNA-degrading endonuclease toxin of MazEF toxin-antitoxin module